MALVENGPGSVVLGAGDRALAVAAVKARLRVVSDDEDALVAAFAETALGLAERIIGQAVIARAMAQLLVGTGGWQRLGARPVRAIAGVTAAPGGEPVAGHAVDIDGDGAGWLRAPRGMAATVAFTAGLATDWAALPTGLREGAAMLAAHLFDDRTGTQPLPAAVTALWRPFRIIQLDPDGRR